MTEYSNANNIQIMGTIVSRNGSTDVTVVRENFGADVVRILDSIWKSETGGALLRNLGSEPGMVFITPRPGTGNPKEAPNSEASSRRVVGKISFEPDAWPSQPPTTINASEALLHELVHSLRQLSGHFDQQRTYDSYFDLEEFYAIVVGNVYRSELQRIGLRGGHGSESLPPKQRDDAAIFLKTGEHRKRLERLRRENEDLFRVISDVVKAKWNPIRLLAHPGKTP